MNDQRINVSKDRNFNGSNVYLALRPNLGKLMGRRIHNEHITVEYLGNEVSFHEILDAAKYWHGVLGLEDNHYVQVHVNGYASWCSNTDSMFYNVALIDFPDRAFLNYKKNWHLTLEKDVLPIDPIMLEKWDIENLYDNCYQLWIGYDDEDGNQQWLSSLGPVNLKGSLKDSDRLLSPLNVSRPS